MLRIFLPVLLALSMFVGSGEIIQACVANDTGVMRIVGEGAACSAAETALQWGVVGLQGPAGPQGPQGPQGAPGVGDLGCATDQIAKWDDTQSQWVCASLPDATGLQAQVTSLQGELAALQQLLEPVSRIDSTLVISGANLQIVNGTGATDSTPNGLGNLIIGYNEERVSTDDDPNPVNERSGSHMLVVGRANNYTSYGGIVNGYYNTTTGPFASVTGGYVSSATGSFASVSGGYTNIASGMGASISGGGTNQATAAAASVSGGMLNQATNNGASVSGGQDNRATASAATVSGALSNIAGAESATVSGGQKLVADEQSEHLP